jgi:hypothetical protein
MSTCRSAFVVHSSLETISAGKAYFLEVRDDGLPDHVQAISAIFAFALGITDSGEKGHGTSGSSGTSSQTMVVSGGIPRQRKMWKASTLRAFVRLSETD